MAFVMFERDSLEPDGRPRNEQSSLERGVGSSKIEGLRGTMGSPSTGFFWRRRRLSASFWRRATRFSTRLSSATSAPTVSRTVLACVSMALTSSWTDETAASAPSTAVASTVVAATRGATTTGATVATPEGVAAFFATAFFAGAATTGAATGAATTGAATTGTTVLASAFLETVFLEVAGVEAFIILEAVEVFMAGIRIMYIIMESIFDPTFHFCRAHFLEHLRHNMSNCVQGA